MIKLLIDIKSWLTILWNFVRLWRISWINLPCHFVKITQIRSFWPSFWLRQIRSDDWFKRIKNKHLYKFATFDIKEFYPSIKECLLKNAINFAEQHTEISEKDKAIIYHSRKSLQSNAKYLEQSLFLSIEPTKGPPPPRWSMLAGQFRAKTTLLLGEGVKRLCSNIFCTWLSLEMDGRSKDTFVAGTVCGYLQP